MYKTFALLLSVLLLCAATPVMADPPDAYGFPYASGVIHQLTYLPGGDKLQAGSYGRTTADGRNADMTVSRIAPDGTAVWTLDFPLPEAGGSPLMALSQHHYVIITAGDGSDLYASVIDIAQGTVEAVPVPSDQQRYYAIDGGIVTVGEDQGMAGILLHWLQADGRLLRQKNYAFVYPQTLDVQLLETDNALYLLAQYYQRMQGAENTLMKLTKDGLLQWRKPLGSPYPYVHVLHSDGEGGLLMIGGNGMYDDRTAYPYTAMRIDAQSNTVWETEIEVGTQSIRWSSEVAEGVRMIWETEDAFRFVTMDRDGNLSEEPAYEKPIPDAQNCSIAGYATDETERVWIYYNAIWNDGEIVKPYLQPLDTFAVRAQ